MSERIITDPAELRRVIANFNWQIGKIHEEIDGLKTFIEKKNKQIEDIIKNGYYKEVIESNIK